MQDNNTMRDENNASIETPFTVSRDFKGIWIPREIWLHPGLSCLEKSVWAEIHSLYDRNRGGCYASNSYLASFFGMSDRYIREIIAKLKSLNLLVEISFDGRQRVIAAIMPKEDLSCGERNFSARQTGTTVPPSAEPQFHAQGNHSSSPSIIYRKGKRKEDIPPNPQGGNGVFDSSFSSSGKKTGLEKKEKSSDGNKPVVSISKPDLEKLYADHGKEVVDAMTLEMEDYCLATGKRYKDCAAAMRSWMRRKKNESPAGKQSVKSAVDRRRRDNFGNIVADPLTDNLF